MQRVVLVLLTLVNVALICLVVQAIVAYRSRPSVENPAKYQDIVEEVKKEQQEALKYRGAGWGTVKGRVVWSGGDIPERQPIDIGRFKDNADPCLQRFPLYREEWVVNKANKGVRWSIAWLVQEPMFLKEKLAIHPDLQKPPNPEVVVDAPCYAFVPHAVALREGQTLVIKNSPAVALGSKRRQLPGSSAPPGEPVTFQLKPEDYPIALTSKVYPWMKGWVGIFGHPYFAVTDADGRFELRQAPTGKYRLRIWHETAGLDGNLAGKLDVPITIKPGEVTDIGDKDMRPLLP